MTAPLIVGVPSAAHREALLRETAGGGRVPTMIPPDPPLVDGGPLARRAVWRYGRYGGPPVPHEDGGAITLGIHPGAALILSHPTDPEAGAMGLARLAWVTVSVLGGGRPETVASWAWRHFPDDGPEWHVWLPDPYTKDGRVWVWRESSDLPALATATSAAHAIGLVAVHLGLLDRVELVEVAP